MKLSDDGLDLIKRSEGFRNKAYPDPGTGAEPWTIAYGHTAGVRPGDTCTEAQGDRWLREDVRDVDNMLNARIVGHTPESLTQYEYDALGSFLFNTGPGGKGVKDGLFMLKSGRPSTLYRSVLAGDMHTAAHQFRLWANPPLLGLRIRRERERVMFTGGDWRDVRDGVEPW